MMTKLNNLSQRYIKAKEEDSQEDFTIITMIREIIKIDICQIMEIREYHSVVEYNVHRLIEIDQGIIRTREVI